jgi:hypothetical protein
VEERKKDRHVSEMCCVLTTVVTDSTDNCLWYVHVGDTRLYRFRNGVLQKLTKDHSFVGIREDAGELSEQEAMHHPHRNQILREVGSTMHRLDDEDFMDYGREEYLPGDLLLLCSDGLTDMVPSQQISAILSTDHSLNDKTQDLVTLANDLGGHDNITVVLVQQQLKPVKTKKENPLPVVVKKTEMPVSQKHKAKKTEPEKGKLFWVFLLVLLIAGAGWYLTPTKKSIASQPPVPVESVSATDNSDTNQVAHAEPRYHAAVPGPVIQPRPDTMRLASSKNWTDIRKFMDSTHRSLVLIPDKKNYSGSAALRITNFTAKSGDTVTIHNLKIIGFDIGIDIRIPVVLKTENLVLENVKTPFNYRFKPDSAHTTVLFMNTLNL